MAVRVFLVHRWDGTKKSDWYPWLVKELEEKGIRVRVLEMPHGDAPKIDEWVTAIKKAVKKPTKETYFIGHSIGCQAIMRYLDTLPEKSEVGGCLFVAGWFQLKNLENSEIESIAKPWMTLPIDLIKIGKISPRVTVLLSENDWYGCVHENASIFQNELGARVLIEKNRGHYTKEDDILFLPVAVTEFMRLIGHKDEKPTLLEDADPSLG